MKDLLYVNEASGDGATASFDMRCVFITCLFYGILLSCVAHVKYFVVIALCDVRLNYLIGLL